MQNALPEEAEKRIVQDSMQKESKKERRGRGDLFRSRHPVYRSFVRDAAPMAWRSRQIIITNHQLFARNG